MLRKFLSNSILINGMFKVFKRYGKKYLVEIILAPIFKIFEAIFGLIIPLIVKDIIDNGIGSETNPGLGLDYVVQKGLLILLLGIVGFIMTMVCQALAVKVSSNYGYLVRKDLYKKINELSLAEIDSFTPSSLQTRLTSDVVATQRAFTNLLRLAIRAPFIVVGSIVMAAFVSPEMSWIYLLCGVLLGLSILLIGYFSIPYNSRIQADLDKLTLIASDNLSGARIVRSFNKQEYEKRKFKKYSDRVQMTSKALSKFSSLSNPFNIAIVNLGFILVLYFSTFSFKSGTLSDGDVTVLINYMTQISQAIVVVANLIVIFSKGSASGKRIEQVLSSKSSLIQGTKVADFKSAPSIEFNDVSFRYTSQGEDVVSNISLKFMPGQRIGIIGGTGAGKSTLMNLLSHLYDPNKGEVLINGINIKDYDDISLKSQIGFVSQNPTLFTGTIESNLRFGKKDASEEEIKRAIEISQSSETVKVKGGLQSYVNRDASNFSGGQKQRLTIARALAKSPKILILDDAFSALDFKTDYQLRKALNENLKNVDIFIVSQRVSTIKNCDEIVVLDKGRIHGVGKHEELTKTCKIYREFCQSQGMKL